MNRKHLDRAAIAAIIFTSLSALAFSGYVVQRTAAAFTDQTHSKTAHIAREWVPGGLELPEFPDKPVFQHGLEDGGRMRNTGLGLDIHGDSWIWGLPGLRMDGSGQNTTWSEAASVPVKVQGLQAGTIRQVTGMTNSVNALDEDGHVWGWGGTQASQGTDISSSVSGNFKWAPLKLRVNSSADGTGPYLDHIVYISSNDGAGAAIKDDGTIWRWGPDPTQNIAYSGNVELGASQFSGMPDPTLPGKRPVYLKGSETDMFAILEDGEVWFWGQDDKQSATPPATDVKVDGVIPHKLDALKPWMKSEGANPYIVDIDGGDGIGGALLSDGTVLTWSRSGGPTGRNGSGDPALVPELTDVTTMSYGYRGAMFLKNDGTMWAYGTGDAQSGYLPSKTTKLDDDVKYISAGEAFMVWMKTNGEFWGMGYNVYAQIGMPALKPGDATQGYRTSPGKILWNGQNLLKDIDWE
ncbi:MAG: hypothetical protein LBR21_09770 [Propionibacteriaceae bacterium]|nr:hypothetical protein [Propionibacteriaceae bacterium]